MREYILKIKLLSPALIGSGEGYGATLDADSVFDATGLPIIPAKRVKGWLRDACADVADLFRAAEVSFTIKCDELFGTQGQQDPSLAHFGNLQLKDHHKMRPWLKYLGEHADFQQLKHLFGRATVIEALSCISHNIAIAEDGVTADHTLRTIRMVEAGTEFVGAISLRDENKDGEFLLYLACCGLRNIGGSRNRGAGEVICTLWHNGEQVDLQARLEELCTA